MDLRNGSAAMFVKDIEVSNTLTKCYGYKRLHFNRSSVKKTEPGGGIAL